MRGLSRRSQVRANVFAIRGLNPIALAGLIPPLVFPDVEGAAQ
jgi:hypothetical protein